MIPSLRCAPFRLLFAFTEPGAVAPESASTDAGSDAFSLRNLPIAALTFFT